MKQIESPCPWCESPQKFPTRIRNVDGCNWQEVYISCTMCSYEVVLRATTKQIESTRRLISNLAHRQNYEMKRHGKVSGNTQAAIRRQRKRLMALNRELQQRIRGHGGNNSEGQRVDEATA